MSSHINLNNLNEAGIRSDYETGGKRKQDDNSRTGGAVSVYFKNLVDHLVAHTQSADVVVGCVAWLTNPTILKALARKQGVSIIVQKEDFLRPDADHGKDSNDRLRKLYAALPTMVRDDFEKLRNMSTCVDPDIDAVRCMGVRPIGGRRISPKMHHKFVVFCRIDSSPPKTYEEIDAFVSVPYAVWTGSFNFTKNGSLSLENAVYIEEPEIARAYYDEWAQVAALSESLDWDSEYVDPEWRIGS